MKRARDAGLPVAASLCGPGGRGSPTCTVDLGSTAIRTSRRCRLVRHCCQTSRRRCLWRSARSIWC